ncbi:MAG: hypothetical protein PHY07_01795, partial [Methanosarcina sp.]|nr:hypothetical protein [Methanosarcina sp.]
GKHAPSSIGHGMKEYGCKDAFSSVVIKPDGQNRKLTASIKPPHINNPRVMPIESIDGKCHTAWINPMMRLAVSAVYRTCIGSGDVSRIAKFFTCSG